MDDTSLDLARSRLANDLKQALPLKELAWRAIQNGCDPRYVAIRYGLPVEQMLAAKAEHERREELKRVDRRGQ